MEKVEGTRIIVDLRCRGLWKSKSLRLYPNPAPGGSRTRSPTVAV
jgi:hypothetical protein